MAIHPVRLIHIDNNFKLTLVDNRYVSLSVYVYSVIKIDITTAHNKIDETPLKITFKLCESRVGCTLLTKKEYIAISHTWSKNLRDFSKSAKNYNNYTTDMSSLLNKNECSVVNGLYVLAKKIMIFGINYFWVDTICLNQSDLKDIQRDLMHMRDIYRNAAKVICCIQPINTLCTFIRSCEPRSRARPRHILHSMPYDGYTSEQRRILEYGFTKDSMPRWLTRVWTYQEAVLNKECWILDTNVTDVVARTALYKQWNIRNWHIASSIVQDMRNKEGKLLAGTRYMEKRGIRNKQKINNEVKKCISIEVKKLDKVFGKMVDMGFAQCYKWSNIEKMCVFEKIPLIKNTFYIFTLKTCYFLYNLKWPNTTMHSNLISVYGTSFTKEMNLCDAMSMVCDRDAEKEEDRIIGILGLTDITANIGDVYNKGIKFTLIKLIDSLPQNRQQLLLELLVYEWDKTPRKLLRKYGDPCSKSATYVSKHGDIDVNATTDASNWTIPSTYGHISPSGFRKIDMRDNRNMRVTHYNDVSMCVSAEIATGKLLKIRRGNLVYGPIIKELRRMTMYIHLDKFDSKSTFTDTEYDSKKKTGSIVYGVGRINEELKQNKEQSVSLIRVGKSNNQSELNPFLRGAGYESIGVDIWLVCTKKCEFYQKRGVVAFTIGSLYGVQDDAIIK